MPVQNAIDPEIARQFIQNADAKIDAVMEALAANPNAGTRITIPAVTEGRGPDPAPTAALPSSAPAIAPAPAPDVNYSAPKPERTDAQIYDMVGRFLDPALLGPMFVSKPIRRRVFFGIYPSFAEVLSSEKVLGAPPDDASIEVNNLWIAAGELAVVIKGYLWVSDPGIETMIANAGDPKKWPVLNRFWFANNRDPKFGSDIVALWQQYKPWKDEVTPTEADLEKYYARNG